jgi:putative hemolysin
MENDSSPLSSIIVFPISLILFSLASFAESGIASVRRERVQWLSAQKASGAGILYRLYTLPLGPTGAVTLLMYFSFTASLLSTVALVVMRAGVNWGLITLAAFVILALMGLVHGIARVAAPIYGEKIALRMAAPIRALAWLLNPFLAAGEFIAHRALRTTKAQVNGTLEGASSDLSLEPNGEPLDEREVRMIRGIVQLDDTVAREIMVPRVDMVVAEIEVSMEEMADLMVSTGHSRIPVYRENLDRIEGIAYARDILHHMVKGNGTPEVLVGDLIRPALFIPESKTLEELLSEFQRRRVHMAIVVDEYGGVSGLATIEDLLEEIVGEIMDEFDVGEPEVEAVSEDEYLIDARVSIDQLKELLGVQVETNGFDTLGGFVYQRLGKIPSPGDTVDYDGLNIEVVSTVGRRIKRLRVTRRHPVKQTDAVH